MYKVTVPKTDFTKVEIFLMPLTPLKVFKLLLEKDVQNAF